MRRSVRKSRWSALLGLHAGWYALLAAIGLTLIGIEAIKPIEPVYAQKQMVHFLLGLMTLPLLMLPRPRVIGLWSYFLLGLTIALLVFLVFPGVPRTIVPRINNATSWIDLRFVRVQPSELSKITFVLAIAWYLRHRQSYRSLKALVLPFAMMGLPVMLILLQPDLGTAMVYLPTLLIILIAAGARLKHIGALVGSGVLVVAIAAGSIFYAPAVAGKVLKPHQQDRIKAMVRQVQGDSRYDNTLNFQAKKSRLLIGSGGLYGNGRAQSAILVRAHRLPLAYNDMIFAVIVNRWGLIGAMAVLSLYMVILLSITAIGAKSSDPFVRLTLVGFAGLLFSQATINIAVNIGLLPVTGITLPFVSYGGSSLVVTFMLIGLVMNLATQQRPTMTRRSFQLS